MVVLGVEHPRIAGVGREKDENTERHAARIVLRRASDDVVNLAVDGCRVQ